MPVISRASIQNLKARVDIVDVVSSVVALKRAGSKFKGLSPFNAEKTPSFFVSPDKGLFKCFSSGKAGDAISFVMETERLGFTEAVEALAKRFNVALEYEGGGPTREERSLRTELMDLHEEVTQAYREAFLGKSDGARYVRTYWTEKRKFTPEVAEDFKIGFAEPDGGRVLERLRKRGFSEDALRQCGLFFARGTSIGGVRFRGRLMIPIRDHQGRVVAFTARQLDVTPADDPAREAKYVNSPETPIFSKGSLLFNLDRARKTAGEGQPFLMVEGQLDAIRCWTAGLTSTIAPQGTGVTEMQMQLLRRYHAGLECLLDGDRAGQAAALRLLPLALREGLEITFLPLAGDGKVDPDDLVREHGAAAIEDLRKHRVGAMRFAATALAPHPETMSAQQLANVCQELFAIVKEATSEVAQAEYLGEIGAMLRLNRTALESDFRRFRETAARRASRATSASASPPDAAPVSTEVAGEDEESSTDDGAQDFSSVERDLLMLVLHFEELGKQLAHAINHEWIDKRTRSGRLLDQFLNDFEHDVWPGTARIEEHVTGDADRSFLASMLFETPAVEDPVRVANDGIRQIVSNFCEPKIRKIELEIAAKQRNFDADLILLLKTNEELRRLKLHPPTIRPPA